MTYARSVEIVTCINRALEEDIGDGDATTNSIVSLGATLRGKIVAKQSGVVAGLEIAASVFHQLDKDILFQSLVKRWFVGPEPYNTRSTQWLSAWIADGRENGTKLSGSNVWHCYFDQAVC
jgi:hypothetical protein